MGSRNNNFLLRTITNAISVLSNSPTIDNFGDGVMTGWSVFYQLIGGTFWGESGGTMNYDDNFDETQLTHLKNTTYSRANGVDWGLSVKMLTRVGWISNTGQGLTMDQNDVSTYWDGGANHPTAGTNGVSVFLLKTGGVIVIKVEKKVAGTWTTLATVSTGEEDPIWLRSQRVGTDFKAYYKFAEGDAWTLIGTYDISAITQTLNLNFTMINQSPTNAVLGLKFDDLRSEAA